MRKLIGVVALTALVVGCTHVTSGHGIALKPQVGSWGFDVADMDLGVRPGDDFFGYTLGSWIDATEIEAEQVCAGVNEVIDNQLLLDVDDIIDRARSDRAPKGDPAQQLGDLYKSYADEDVLEDRGLDPVQPYLSAIDGVTDHASLNGVLATFSNTLIPDPFPVYVYLDPHDPSRHLPHTTQGGLSLDDRDYYLEQDPDYADIRDQYVAHVERTLALAGYADAADQARRVLATETRMAEVQWPLVDTYDPLKTSTVMSRADVEKLAAGAPLKQMWDAYGIPGDTDVVVETPDVLANTAKLWAELPPDDWKAYLRYKVLAAYGDYLSKPLADEMFDFYDTTLNGVEEQAPRQDYAASFVNNHLSDLVGQRYVAEHFEEQTRDQVIEMVGHTRTAYAAMIDGATWMADSTKAEARAKLDALVAKIGYPREWFSYEGLTIEADDLVGNAERVSTWGWKAALDDLGKPVDREDWTDISAQENNASYGLHGNDITFPAGILQAPFFDPGADPAANYGAIGATIGHEMTHAFDSDGRKFDATGALRDWWVPADAERYRTQTDALVAQFGQYEPLPGDHIDGALTLGENIADLAGLEVAYDAYRLSLGGEEAPIIDGLTGDQRFFLAYAASWKQVCRDEFAEGSLQTDVHAPAKFRVNGIVRNMDEWYAAFDVKEGDELYLPPDQRVRIW